MPGDGEVIPNGSMHWHITHRGKPAPWTGVPAKVPGSGQDVGQDSNRVLYGIDPAKHGSPLQVTLRFASNAVANTALQNATRRAHGPSGMWEVIIDVPLIDRTGSQAEDPPPNSVAQLVFSWR